MMQIIFKVAGGSANQTWTAVLFYFCFSETVLKTVLHGGLVSKGVIPVGRGVGAAAVPCVPFAWGDVHARVHVGVEGGGAIGSCHE